MDNDNMRVPFASLPEFMKNDLKKTKTKKRIPAYSTLAYLGLSGLTVLAFSAIFPPVDWTFLAFVALVPWLIVVQQATQRAQLAISFFAGLASCLINSLWGLPITIPGYISMSIYLALYWPVLGFMIQRLQRRWSVPFFLAVPLVWVAGEYVRSWLVTGFPWFFLGHSQASNPIMIQIADLGGAYAVSFVLALINGALAQLIIDARDRHIRKAIPAVATAAVLLVSTVLYGRWRLIQNVQTPGPVISVVQEDFPLFVDKECSDFDEVLRGLLAVSVDAAREKPDMLVWPETCIGISVNPEFLNAKKIDDKYLKAEHSYSVDVADILSKHAKVSNSYLVVGAISKQINPPGTYPSVDKFNSALIYDRQGRYVDRYDKIRLVLFGEVVPFRYSWPALYRFLNENMTPYGQGGYEYSLTAGKELKRFILPTAAGNFRYSVAICYEDTMADLIRQFAAPADGKKQIDFLVNISNDGWFNHSCELLQHFYISIFRAVENRIAVVRSVNTGISGIIGPDGRIDAMVTDGSRIYGPGIRGYQTRQLKIDPRVTLYSSIGDWPVISIMFLVILSGVINPIWLKKKTPELGDDSHETICLAVDENESVSGRLCRSSHGDDNRPRR